METAGKFVEDEELRDALKENGIGRPSTRAAIIETLFKRHYIQKQRKTLVATATGVELIGLIHEELLKSAELTGQWERKLRMIERHEYSARQFIDELKQMVTDIIQTVRADNSNRRVTVTEEPEKKKKRPAPAQGEKKASSQVGGDATNVPAGFQPKKRKAKTSAHPKVDGEPSGQNSSPLGEVRKGPQNEPDPWVGLPCPVCGEGKIIKGHTAYGCSRWKEGCTYRAPFT
jgi:DNA topoisomerase-3